MISGYLGDVVVVLVLILINGLLSLSEMALVSSRKSRLIQMAAEGSAGAKVALELAMAPSGFLAAIQTGITIISIVSGAYGGITLAERVGATLAAWSWLGPWASVIGIALVISVITLLSLVLGELIPKRIALHFPEDTAVLVARPLKGMATALAPMVRMLSFATEGTLRIFKVTPPTEPPVTEEEVKLLIDLGAKSGVFAKEEGKILKRVLRLDDLTAADLMTPRTKIVSLNLEDPLEVNRRVVMESMHSFFPVFQGSVDNLVGVVAAKSILQPAPRGVATSMVAVMTEPLFVSESMPVLTLLTRIKQTGKHFAIVIDEYGSGAGIVTAMDILEAMVGDIPVDTPSGEISAFTKRKDGSFLIDGTMGVHELSDILKFTSPDVFKDADYQTVSGFVMSQLGRIPREAESFIFNGYLFEVVDMDGRRVDKVLAVSVKRRKASKKAGAAGKQSPA